MATMLVQFNVQDFEAWRKVYDANTELRKTNGGISHQVFRDASDANKVIIVNQWDSIENAQAFARSQELRIAQDSSGVIGTPEVSFLIQA